MAWRKELAQRLSDAVNGEKDRIIEEYKALTGRSAATLYRIAAANGFKSDRKPREDKGTLRSELNEEQLRFISAQMQTTAREVKGVIMAVRKALDIAIDNGVIEKGQISVSGLQRILREREMNAAALDSVSPSIRMASLHPNHVHVFDASICIQYYLKGKKGLRLMDERDFREKKPANVDKIKQRLIRMILVDHTSHFIFPRYYVAAGENQRITFDFLTTAWRGGLHDKIPFRGVPFFLLMDAGSANIAKGILNFLERLEIDIPKNMPHNPKRQGSAEVAQNIVERDFEACLRLEPATTIEELNAWALDWCAYYNATQIHRRHQETRTANWLRIKNEQLRNLPCDEILQDLYAEPEVERTVRQDNTIGFRNEDYRLRHISGIRPGKKVRVILRPYSWPQVGVVFNDTEYLVEPIGTLANGFSADAAIIGQEYKDQRDTPVDTVRKANENLAYGEERKKDALPFGGSLQVMGHQAEKLGNLTMFPHRGHDIDLAPQRGPVMLPITEAFKRLKGHMTPQLNRDMRAAYGDSIEAAELERVVAQIIETGTFSRDDAESRQAL